MKRVKITLKGTLTYFAERTLEIEVSDNETLTTVSPNTLNELADSEKVSWSFSEWGHLEPTDFTVDDCPYAKMVDIASSPIEENHTTA